MFTPVHFVLLIVFLTIILSLLLVVLSNNARLFFRENYKYLLAVLIISIICTFPYNYHFFFGQEYEDAFVYTEYARHLLYNQNFSFDPFLVKGCAFGSLKNCLLEVTYGGHLLGLPSVGYFFSKYFGYSSSIICIINFIASLISVCLIYCVSYILSNDRKISLACALIYAVTPAMTLFHTSGLSETLSSTSVIFTFLLYLILVERPQDLDKRVKLVTWIIIFMSFSLCLLQRRENLILIFMPFITIVRMIWARQWRQDIMIRISIFMIMGIMIVLAYLYYAINILNIERQESYAITSATFSFTYFASLTPVFISAFFTIKLFFVFSLFTIVGFVIIPAKFRTNQLYIYPLILFLAYFLSYTLHYRSYYFIKYGDVHEFESLRYITNFFPFYCLITGYAICHACYAFGSKVKIAKLSYLALSIIIAGYLVYANVSLKNEYYNIEQKSRIIPVKETLKHINQANSSIITDMPLVFQIFGDDSLVLIDAPSLGRNRCRSFAMDMIMKGTEVYYLKSVAIRESYNNSRWPVAMKFIDSLSLEQVEGYKVDGFMLYRVIKGHK